jgi:ureidoglycolate lyase
LLKEPAMTDVLTVQPLSTAAFAPFGQVIAAGSAARHFAVNDGSAERFDDLATLDTTRAGGRPVLSIFRAKPRLLPLQLRLVERHQLGSQAFVPLALQRFLVVVAPPGPAPEAAALRCFLALPGQGVNFAAGTWHHPLIALDGGGDFLVIDRAAADGSSDCQEHLLAGPPVFVQDCRAR